MDEGNQSAIAGVLNQGLQVLDLQKEIKFRRYARVVLPLDGYVFWYPAEECDIEGSLHFTQEILQEEDQTYGAVGVTFTVRKRIARFEECPIDSIYVGSIADTPFAFSQQGARYDQAGVWHYVGHSIPPAMQSQLIGENNQPDPSQAIVSNSLPLWLQLNTYAPFGGALADLFRQISIKLYPADLVIPNLRAPYGVVDVQDTESLQSAPLLDQDRNSHLLCKDRVRVTLWGLQNNAAIDFLNSVNQYSVLTGNFGLANSPAVVDDKRKSQEMQAIGMCKTIEFDINYDQHRVDTVARQLISKALITVQLNTKPIGN